jgi:hypothetical protein
MCDSLRVTLVVWSSVSPAVSSVVEAAASWSSSERKMACVDIGRSVDDESSA